MNGPEQAPEFDWLRSLLRARKSIYRTNMSSHALDLEVSLLVRCPSARSSSEFAVPSHRRQMQFH